MVGVPDPRRPMADRRLNQSSERSLVSVDPVRARAAAYLKKMPEEQAQHFADLLLAASQEYFLVVMLDSAESHQFLTCEAPLIPAVKSLTRRRRALWSVLPVSNEFTVNYATQIPRGVDSYHVTMDVPEELDVRRFVLCSNADEPAIHDLARRAEAVAARSSLPDAAGSTSLTLERRELETTLGVLGQRRRVDLRGFDQYLQGRRRVSASALRQPSPAGADGDSTCSIEGLAHLRGASAEQRFEARRRQGAAVRRQTPAPSPRG